MTDAGLLTEAPTRAGAGSTPARGWPALLAVTLILVGAVVALWFVATLPADRADRLGSPAATALLLVGMGGLGVAGHVLARNGSATAMAVLMSAVAAAWVASHLALGVAVTLDHRAWPGAALAGWVTNWCWVPAHVLSMLMLVRFPTGAAPGPFWRWVERAVVTWGAVAVLATAFLPGPLGAEPLAPAVNPLGIASLEPFLTGLLGLLFLVLPALIVVSAAAPVARWRGAASQERRQLSWIAVAAALLAVSAPLALWSGAGDVLQGLAFLLLPGAIAVAVLREQLWGLDLRRRLDRLQAVRDQERERLRHDLHDSLGPLLGAIAMRAEAGQNLLASGRHERVTGLLGDIGAVTNDALTEVRRMIDELGPSVLVDADLGAAVRVHAEQYADAFPVRLSTSGELRALDPRTAEAGYLIVTEAIRNAARHSQAAGCEVRLVELDGSVTLTVSDAGRGMGGSRPGVGTLAMTRRAELVGGRLEICEPPSGGVRVVARLPGASS